MIMLELVKILGSGDCAIILNGTIIKTVDPDFPEDGSVSGLESLAENLAEALCIPIVVRVLAVENPEWTWLELVADLLQEQKGGDQ